jgi:putative hydrolase of the HAD superfamily
VARIRAVIFDLGRVLVDFDHAIAGSKIALLAGKTPSEIQALFFESELVQSFEAGTISPRVFFAGVQQRLDLDIPFEQFVLIWNSIFYMTEANKAANSMLGILRPRYTLAMLSNINVLHYEYLKKTTPIFGSFHHLFASCEMGFVKPDERIYKAALGRLGVEPREAFYTDDRPEMVAAACGLGIRGFLFTGPGQLEKDLAGCGVYLKE